MAKVTSITKGNKPVFEDIRKWHEDNMHPSVMNFDDPKPYEVYEKGMWAGIFQCTGQGAQQFFIKSKPKSIVDVAALTSIFRPGPLAAGVDKLWTKHIVDHYDWGHPLINDTLKETRGLLVFQEGVMALANKVAGFPLDQTDEVRRAIMKRSTSTGEAAKKKMQELEDSFVVGCVKNGVPESIAKKAYDTISWMSGYAFNKAHAVAYAIDSFWCAWFMTYYTDEWLTAYLESMSGNPEKKVKAIGEIKRLGYSIVPIDINYAAKGWTALPGKRFMPSLLSCKGVGDAAIDELLANRPFKSIEDLLWNEDGSWKHSKFNKRALEALIKICALDSLGCVGEGCIFSSYRHMHAVVIENMDAIKKSTKRDPHLGRKNFFELARTLGPIPEWTRLERVENQVEVFGNLDVSLLIDPEVLRKLEEKDIQSIDSFEEVGIYWFCVQNVEEKKTQKGSAYINISAVGPVGKTYYIKVWNWDVTKKLEPYTILMAKIAKNDFGFSTKQKDIKELK